jgi:predicted KAP-like P-loop ATPase
MNGKIPDRPSEIDLLQREELIQTLADILVTRIDSERCEASNIVLGLTGPWGSGKSTVVAQLKEHLGSLSRVVVVEVNPWLLGERDDLIRGFFAQVQSAFMASTIDTVREIAGAVAPYAKWLGSKPNHPIDSTLGC